MVAGPKLPTFADLKNYLRKEPLYNEVFEEYLRNTARIIEDLRRGLESSQRHAHDAQAVAIPSTDIVRRASPPRSQEQLEMIEDEEEEQAPATVNRESVLDVDEMADCRRMPHEPFANEGAISDVVPEARLAVRMQRRIVRTREIVLRSRTVRVPIVNEGWTVTEVAGAIQPFNVPKVGSIPERHRQMLVAPKIDPYTIIRKDDGSIAVGCGLCAKEFSSLKGWRIHSAKAHVQNGFCQRCCHFVNMPPHVASNEEIRAIMELHSMEWCPMATKTIINERAAKRRRLQLAGRSEEAQRYFIPRKLECRAMKKAVSTSKLRAISSLAILSEFEPLATYSTISAFIVPICTQLG
uniref:C2H2-type domain-containing protein n=1 Tax=Setaria digitata TaxID=48799 RepID=A0A915Q0K4_9BILA